jgi:CheY-like chemotaxis protein
VEEGQRRIKILLIDDEKSVLFALKLLLDALGYEVTDFCFAEEALMSLSSKQDYDLCICDLKMPKLNGIQVLEKAKSMAPSLPFVLMSAHAQNDEIEQAKNLGAHGFLAKPFTPEQLKAVVNEIIAVKPI